MVPVVQLKMCPFCGGIAEIRKLDGGKSYLVGCIRRDTDCAVGPFVIRKYEDQAVADWNARR